MPWRRAWQLTPVFLPGESHGQKSPVGNKQSMRLQRVGHNLVTKHTHAVRGQAGVCSFGQSCKGKFFWRGGEWVPGEQRQIELCHREVGILLIYSLYTPTPTPHHAPLRAAPLRIQALFSEVHGWSLKEPWWARTSDRAQGPVGWQGLESGWASSRNTILPSVLPHLTAVTFCHSLTNYHQFSGLK